MTVPQTTDTQPADIALPSLEKKKSLLAGLEVKLEQVKTGENRCMRNALIAAVATVALLVIGIVAMVTTMGLLSVPLSALIPAIKGSMAHMSVATAAAAQALLLGGAALGSVGVLCSMGIGMALAVGLKPKESRQLEQEVNALKADIKTTEQEEQEDQKLNAILARLDTIEMATNKNELIRKLDHLTTKFNDTANAASQVIEHGDANLLSKVESIILQANKTTSIDKAALDNLQTSIERLTNSLEILIAKANNIGGDDEQALSSSTEGPIMMWLPPPNTNTSN